MSETVLVALITASATVLAGALSVVLTQRHSDRRTEAERKTARQADMRTLVALLVGAGRDWANANESLVPVYFKAGKDLKFWLEWPDTDSGKKLREDAQTVRRATGELRLIANDTALLDLTALATSLLTDEKPLAALLDEARRTGAADFSDEAMRNAFRHYQQAAATFDAIEDRAAQLLRGDV